MTDFPLLDTTPSCSASGIAQSLTTGILTTLALASESWDTNNLHDNVTNNSRILLNKVGFWVVSANLFFAANAVGLRVGVILTSGATQDQYIQYSAASADLTRMGVNTIVRATVTTDYVEVRAYQDSGGALNVTPSFLRVAYLGTSS